MFYILKSSKSKNLKPEIPYDLGNISLPIGSFIFDTTEKEFFYNIRNDLLIFDGEHHTINNRLIFNDPIKAKLIFLKIKIDEMQASSFSFFSHMIRSVIWDILKMVLKALIWKKL